MRIPKKIYIVRAECSDPYRCKIVDDSFGLYMPFKFETTRKEEADDMFKRHQNARHKVYVAKYSLEESTVNLH